ncbi:uncharacterized protein BO80DRAFT_97044 [Aspergillus ibericus CBS 121593]|uniref:DUF7580 domain-containing protein n=1 Tax=Aspergillus ibericus CBS 121593 TaxID=1448316 RepID=A0A395GXU8_9EURO|nr:hypothetical protein BO80DRAFT_97044 [Aspergillus ibericus CBS 121593]RAL00411.1 hypothetical protein BO80DRAFT_97044 [Aspergillus ibericus CBS 121593]
MVTGVETVGIVLAILPLLINQLDQYVQGIETLKLFGKNRYRRELDSYRTNIETQKAIFVNTLILSLDGVVEYAEEIGDLIERPHEGPWTRPDFKERFKQRFGDNFGPFEQTMSELSELLAELSDKLGLESQGTKPLWDQPSTLEREITKLRHILKKSVYADLLNRIRTANSMLKILVDQTHQRQAMRSRLRLKQPLVQQRRARRAARSLYRAMICEKYWDCPCKEQHYVQVILGSQSPDTQSQVESSQKPRFRMVFASKMAGISAASWNCWHEVEFEADTTQEQEAVYNFSTIDISLSTTSSSQSNRNVRFSVTPAFSGNSTMVLTEPRLATHPINNICSTLSRINDKVGQQTLLGFLTDETSKHNAYHLRCIPSYQLSQSLEDLVTASSASARVPSPDGLLFSRRNRLRLAAKLATSVFQYHGSWLKSYWRARDIMFLDDPSSQLQNPYIPWNVACDLTGGNGGDARKKGGSAASGRNGLLFPLGLVLVELSLCQTLEVLYTSEDGDGAETIRRLNTAMRYLPAVEIESGWKYAEVVRQCLWWPHGRKPTDLENERLQEEVFQLIVLPLMEDLRDFEGRSRLE